MIIPVDIHTNNVAREIIRIASKNSVPASTLYIKSASATTFRRDNNSNPIEISYEDFDKYTQEEVLRDSTIEFVQEYDVSICSKPNYYPFAQMNTEIEFEDKSTIVNLIIKKGSVLEYYDHLYTDFLNYIVEQQLRSNVMIELFDVNYEESIKSFVDVIKQINKITFKEDKKILLSQGLREELSIQAEVTMTIESDKEEEDKHTKVNHSDRGFLINCTKGEELFEFAKPKQGKHGRNCLGNIIEVEIVDLDATPEFSVDDNIEIVDSFENIKYLATKSGYLLKDGDHYDVSNSIEVDEISFKTTGTIDTDLDTEISINIVKKNPLEDAIEKGMHVKVQNISIEGSIGPNTKIEARNVSLCGQTHADSLIKCVNADLGTHKGKIVARHVEVMALQGGEIIADSVKVTQALNGKIKAKTIEIKILGSHVTLEASEYIKIEKTRGEENKFILDATIDSGLDKKNTDEDEHKYLKRLKEELSVLLDKYKNTAIKVKKNLEPCKKIKEALLQSKAKGIKLSSVLIDKYKLCQVMNVRYKKLREEVEFKKSQYDELNKKLSSSIDIMNSELILGEPLNGFNIITYKLSNPDRQVELNIDESMNKKVFQLIEDEDGVLKIVNI